MAPFPQEDIGRIWGYQVLRAWTTGWGKGKVVSSFRYQVQRMRMRLLLPGNLGAAGGVSLPGGDPGSCDGTSSVPSLTIRSDSRLELSRIQVSSQQQESSFGSIRALEEGLS